MNQWFQFKMPGTYSLTSQLTADIDVSGDGSLPPESQTAQLQVNPRNPARLNKICAELAKQVEMAPNAEAAQEPARMLSYVEDPIAVPYLAEVLSSHKLTDEFAIPGLERIGDDEAVEVLLSALDDKFGDISDSARQALARMKDRISNPMLKERVRLALEPKRSDYQNGNLNYFGADVTITRKVFKDTDGFWKYQIAKSGYTNTVRLPNQ